MKKILSLILVITTLALLLCSVGCKQDKEGYESYYNHGLHYDLPTEYAPLHVSYAEFVYYNGEAYFYFDYMSEEKLIEAYLPPDISIQTYAANFAMLNGITTPVVYDKQNDTALLEYVYEYTEDDEVQLPPEFYYHYIIRGSVYIYIVTMSCPADKADVYKPIFNEWIEGIHAD